MTRGCGLRWFFRWTNAIFFLYDCRRKWHTWSVLLWLRSLTVWCPCLIVWYWLLNSWSGLRCWKLFLILIDRWWNHILSGLRGRFANWIIPTVLILIEFLPYLLTCILFLGLGLITFVTSQIPAILNFFGFLTAIFSVLYLNLCFLSTFLAAWGKILRAWLCNIWTLYKIRPRASATWLVNCISTLLSNLKLLW